MGSGVPFFDLYLVLRVAGVDQRSAMYLCDERNELLTFDVDQTRRSVGAPPSRTQMFNVLHERDESAESPQIVRGAHSSPQGSKAQILCGEQREVVSLGEQRAPSPSDLRPAVGRLLHHLLVASSNCTLRLHHVGNSESAEQSGEVQLATELDESRRLGGGNRGDGPDIAMAEKSATDAKREIETKLTRSCR